MLLQLLLWGFQFFRFAFKVWNKRLKHWAQKQNRSNRNNYSSKPPLHQGIALGIELEYFGYIIPSNTSGYEYSQKTRCSFIPEFWISAVLNDHFVEFHPLLVHTQHHLHWSGVCSNRQTFERAGWVRVTEIGEINGGQTIREKGIQELDISTRTAISYVVITWWPSSRTAQIRKARTWLLTHPGFNLTKQ